ncbi:hypothetical protein CPB84DRAFT_1846457 [Gymnopilus junonius]|uniref:MARVEL domain-containing protein n=1 Tax=Gymnopilus junonius TaxID=109634 RepID=A0A9P5NM76_GYMJU|nr:hypothetical protein CPB84DRAFT_1846457 [Gymnopilus junonius]
MAARAEFERAGKYNLGRVLPSALKLGLLSVFPSHIKPSTGAPHSLGPRLHESVMLNLLQLIRYFVFVVFVICNAIITSVAVWNLSLVESIVSDSASRQIDSFLIFVGASGLLLMFMILFFELYGKNLFLGRVWFELAWTGLFFIMELVGAAVITVQSNGQICAPQGVSSPSRDSSCASTQVLQAFTWVLAILLLGYLTLLSILTAVKRKEDPTIWHASVRRFPLASTQSLKSAPTSPLPRFRSKTPVIVAPTPRRAVANREPILSYRSGLSLEYEIEHYQAPTTAFLPPVSQQEPSNIPNATVTTPLPITPLSPQAERVQQPSQLPSASPLYHSAVRSALEDRPGQPKAPPPAHVGPIRRLPPSPPPLGDWPRLDATSRPRTKRKPLPQLPSLNLICRSSIPTAATTTYTTTTSTTATTPSTTCVLFFLCFRRLRPYRSSAAPCISVPAVKTLRTSKEVQFSRRRPAPFGYIKF